MKLIIDLSELACYYMHKLLIKIKKPKEQKINDLAQVKVASRA
jgi:hypothetical protein